MAVVMLRILRWSGMKCWYYEIKPAFYFDKYILILARQEYKKPGDQAGLIKGTFENGFIV
jgi:hypothetical protein